MSYKCSIRCNPNFIPARMNPIVWWDTLVDRMLHRKYLHKKIEIMEAQWQVLDDHDGNIMDNLD